MRNLIPIYVTTTPDASRNILPLYITTDGTVPADNLLPIQISTIPYSLNTVPLYITNTKGVPTRNKDPYLVVWCSNTSFDDFTDNTGAEFMVAGGIQFLVKAGS